MALSNKQRAFVEHYLTCWNATEAARQAGYSGKTASAIGWENLRKPEIQAAIQERLAEFQMGADEVLSRLTQQARGSFAPFVRTSAAGNLIGFNLGEDAPLHLIKKISHTEKGTTIELYDAQAALRLLAQHHGLLVERHEHSGKDGGPITITVIEAIVPEGGE